MLAGVLCVIVHSVPLPIRVDVLALWAAQVLQTPFENSRDVVTGRVGAVDDERSIAEADFDKVEGLIDRLLAAGLDSCMNVNPLVGWTRARVVDGWQSSPNRDPAGICASGGTVSNYVHPHLAILCDAVVDTFEDAGRWLASHVSDPPGGASAVRTAIEAYEMRLLPTDQPMLDLLPAVRKS